MIYYKPSLVKLFESEKSIKDLDFKDWIVKDVESSDKLYSNLKKWIKYSACEYPDADIVLKLDDGSFLKNLEWIDENEKKIHIDCIFSMRTFFNAFLRFYAPDYKEYGQLYDNYNFIFSDAYINLFCEKEEVNKDELKALLVELNKFAKNTHTLGNYMPCPDNSYNAYKGGAARKYKGYQYFQDRIELLYEELQNPRHEDYIEPERREFWKQFLEKKELFLDLIWGRGLKEYKCPCTVRRGGHIVYDMTKDKDSIKKYKDYLSNVNEIILQRGLDIENYYKSKMETK